MPSDGYVDLVINYGNYSNYSTVTRKRWSLNSDSVLNGLVLHHTFYESSF